MEFKEFKEKYANYTKEFNSQSFEERERTSKLMTYEAVLELIRTKQVIKDSIKNIDDRIKILCKQLN